MTQNQSDAVDNVGTDGGTGGPAPEPQLSPQTDVDNTGQAGGSPDLTSLIAERDRLRDQVAGSTKEFQRLKELGYGSVEEAVADLTSVQPIKDRFDLGKFSDVLQPKQTQEQSQDDRFEELRLEIQEMKSASKREKLLSALGQHDKAVESEIDKIKKGVDDLLPDNATDFERTVITEAAINRMYNKMAEKDRYYGDDHALGGQQLGNPNGLSELAVESLRELRKQALGDKVEKIGKKAASQKAPTPGSTTDQGDPTKNAQSKKEARREALREMLTKKRAERSGTSVSS